MDLASNMAGHQRSTSRPPMAHPNKIRIMEALQSMSSVMSSPSSIQTVCDGLRRLGDVHGCINEVICLHSNQQAHGKRLERKKWSGRLRCWISATPCMQESFADLKMTIQELQMVLVRGDLTAARVKAQSYIRLLKKAKRRLLKNVDNKPAISNENEWLVGSLTAARGITVSALKSAVELLSKQMPTCNSTKWSLISKSSQISCEEVQWQALELGLAGLGSSVQNLFRSLIQTNFLKKQFDPNQSLSSEQSQLVGSPLVHSAL